MSQTPDAIMKALKARLGPNPTMDQVLNELHALPKAELEALQKQNPGKLTPEQLKEVEKEFEKPEFLESLKQIAVLVGKSAQDIANMFGNLTTKLSELNKLYPADTGTLVERLTGLRASYKNVTRKCKDQALLTAHFAAKKHDTILPFVCDNNIDAKKRQEKFQEWEEEAKKAAKEAEGLKTDIESLVDDVDKFKGEFAKWGDEKKKGLQGEINGLDLKIAAIEGELKELNSKLTYSGMGLGIGIFASIAAITLTIATAGLAAPLAVVAVGGTIVAAGFFIATLTEISKKQSEKAGLVRQKTDLQAQMLKLDEAKATLKQLVDLSSHIFTQSINVHNAVWEEVRTDFKTISTDLESAKSMAEYSDYMRKSLGKVTPTYKLISIYLEEYGKAIVAEAN